MYCQNCGNKTDSDSIFCTKCGFKIKDETNIINQNKNKKDINKILIISIITMAIICFIIGLFIILGGKDSRTIMIYMTGSDLESRAGLATIDLKHIDFSKKNEKVNVILIAGGTKSWKNDYINGNETSIYELKNTGFVKVKTNSSKSMGRSEVLTDFLNYSYENYQAKKYDLVFWNHGGAIDGSEYDEIVSNDNLKPTEMREALENSHFNSRNKLETIAFRTCLNGTIEMANIFKDYAKYLVASEEVTLGSTFDSALRFVNDIEPKDSGFEFGKKQINNYKETISNYCNAVSSANKSDNYCEDITYSIMDLSKVDYLKDSFDIFMNDLNVKLSNNYNEIAKIRSNITQYGKDEKGYDMIDLYEFVNRYKKYSQVNGNKVLSKLKDVVIYSFANNDYSHGVSIYFPYNGSYFLRDYNNISISNNYETFINNFVNLKKGKKINSFSNFSNQETSFKAKNKEKADFELTLSDEQKDNFAKAQYVVFVDTKDGYHKLLYVGNQVDLVGNTLKANVQGKLLRFSDIDFDDENCWISLVEKKVTDDYVDLESYAVLTRGFKMTVATISIRIDNNHPDGYITSVITKDEQKNNNFSVFSNEGININDYTYIAYASQKYKIVDENGNFIQDFEGNGIYSGLESVTNAFKYIREDFESEYDYYAAFKIYDIQGNYHYSNLVKMN